MGQSDIYEILKSKRLSGDNTYYSVEQIRKMLKENNKTSDRASVHNAVSSLRIYGFLDMKIVGVRRRNKSIFPTAVYRIKRDEML